MALSPSDSALSETVKAVAGPTDIEDDRAVLSEVSRIQLPLQTQVLITQLFYIG